MDTAEVAAELGITARLLRQFLRSDYSTFAAVGSGARYDFTDRDLPTIQKRFSEWKGDGKPRADNDRKPKVTVSRHKKSDVQVLRDAEVWAEEAAERAAKDRPSVAEEMLDIRNPRVRARVLRDAQAAEDRLMQRLLAAGQHITQPRDRKVS
jgi:DNA-binding transcriptional MerR regulator